MILIKILVMVLCHCNTKNDEIGTSNENPENKYTTAVSGLYCACTLYSKLKCKLVQQEAVSHFRNLYKLR